MKNNFFENEIEGLKFNKSQLIFEAMNPQYDNVGLFRFLSLFVLRLDGSNRLNLLKQQSAGDMQKHSKNLLAYIFREDELRSEIRRIIADASGKFFVIDPTNVGYLHVRLADRASLES